MNSAHLNEHDANQGAQSSGEFLGMTGNSGWYLLGSAGATILMVRVGQFCAYPESGTTHPIASVNRAASRAMLVMATASYPGAK